jgi:hypothetical protein
VDLDHSVLSSFYVCMLSDQNKPGLWVAADGKCPEACDEEMSIDIGNICMLLCSVVNWLT